MEKGDDPYRILGLPSKSASESDIKNAYRKLAMREHPDRKTDPKEREAAAHIFAKISNAYEILGDPEKRKEYDALQKEQKQATGTAQGFDRRGVNVCFHSPYEVFKRDFEDMMGFAYPGSKYDFNDRMIANGESSSRKNKKSSSSKDGPKLIKDDPKKNGTSSSTPSHSRSQPYSSSSNNNTNSNSNDRNSSNKTPSSSSSSNDKQNRSNTSSSTSTALVKRCDEPSSSSKNNNKDSRALVAKDDKNRKNNNSENRLVVSQGIEGDNRPISMMTTQQTVKHPDGTVETITETKMERPDGSVETVRTSDCGDKRPDWSKPQKKTNDVKRLTNGEDSKPRLRLTNGNNKKDKAAPLLALTNGPSNNHRQNQSIANNNNNNQQALVVSEKPQRKNILAFWK